MNLDQLTAISPLDGRYASKADSLRPIFSEYGLIYYRLVIEVRWLIHLSEQKSIKEVPELSKDNAQWLEALITNFDENEAAAIKNIESRTNHDVKAIEYYLRDKLTEHGLTELLPFIHFACTSEDINNLSYGLMLKQARHDVILPSMQALIDAINHKAAEYAGMAMLSRTHGQPASPSTLGKELKNVAVRLQQQCDQLKTIPIAGKLNGAVGNFNAHVVAYPDVDWRQVSQTFIDSLGLHYNAYTTQIEPHDLLAELLQCLVRFNNVLIDFNRDIWSYIGIGYFHLQKADNEVGSSTMPHKVNPIDFENSEGNLGIANALATHLANKLPISRWQRDLSDSTALRNVGAVFGHALLAYQASLKGFNKLSANQAQLDADLNQHWEVLAEAIQTVMRRYGISDAYEQLKALTRGETIDRDALASFINGCSLPDAAKQQLRELTPMTYIGVAEELAAKGK